MSKPPTNESELGDASRGSSSHWWLWLVCVVMMPVGYVLGIGPAAWLWKHGYLRESLEVIYKPLDRLPLPTVFAELIREYVELWLN